MAGDAAELKEVLLSVSDMLKPFYAQVQLLFPVADILNSAVRVALSDLKRVRCRSPGRD